MNVRNSIRAYIRQSRFKSVIHRLIRTPMFYMARQPERPCHLKELFVRHNGDVYPCCLVWNIDRFRIGNLHDTDLIDKIDRYHSPCVCQRYKLRRGRKGEEHYDLLNLEMSLACNGKCVMCCVDAPSWKGRYDHYESLMSLVEHCHPKEILVQGGEILIQKHSLEWIEQVKARFPEMKISLVTNGNVGTEMLERVEDLFHRVTISIIGFQEETYRKIVGLSLQKTVAIAENLVNRGNVRVFLKYLVTPLNLHEAPLFLTWAANTNPDKIIFADASTLSYIKLKTQDNFWHKIIERTARDITNYLNENIQNLVDKKAQIGFDSATKEMFSIDDAFIKGNRLERVIFWNRD